MGKSKSKKVGFLKRHHAKRERQRRQRKKALKNVTSPMKQLRSLSAEEIKHYLEDSPLLLAETEFEGTGFAVEAVKKHTDTVLEQYQDRLTKAQSKDIPRKRAIYEEMCAEIVAKLVNKPFIMSLLRRVRSCAKRLKEHGNKEQLTRIVVTEATLNIPQIPTEVHPFIVGIYEKVRLLAYPDFTIAGFEQVLNWQDRLVLEREAEKTVSGNVDNEVEVNAILAADERFQPKDSERGTAYAWMRPSSESEAAQPSMVQAGLLTIVEGKLELKTESYSLAEEARGQLEELLKNHFTEPEEEDEEEAGVDGGADEGKSGSTTTAEPEPSPEERPQPKGSGKTKSDKPKKEKSKKETK
ncbi:hypothetical protein JXQ70_12180 [bacterium]|nr:hypothetical protein [bacterium]